MGLVKWVCSMQEEGLTKGMLKQNYPMVFKGLGTLGMYHITLQDNCTPVINHPRRVKGQTTTSPCKEYQAGTCTNDFCHWKCTVAAAYNLSVHELQRNILHRKCMVKICQVISPLFYSLSERFFYSHLKSNLCSIKWACGEKCTDYQTPLEENPQGRKR